MASKLGRRIQTILFIGSVLIVSACATTNSKETIINKTDETARVTIEKGKFETPPPLTQPATPQPVIEPGKTVSQTEKDAAQAAKATRINPNEPFVNVRSAPSIKSRNIAVLKGGYDIEVLEVKDVWVKIKWMKGNAAKQGWLKKRLVEGYEQ